MKNFWNLTPLSVPYRKDTRSYLENYLERNDIDVNCKDGTGKTLIVQEIIPHKEITEHIKSRC